MKRLTVAVLVGVTGCSLIWQKHLPAKWTIDQPLKCDDTSWWPFDIPGGFVVAGLGVAAFAAAKDSSVSELGNLALLGGIVGAVVYWASAYEGGEWADECERATEQQNWHHRFKGDVDPKLAPHVEPEFAKPHPYCFGYTDNGIAQKRCMPTMDSCRSGREPIAAVTENVTECEETR
jgi:hypothetical protein